MHALNSHEQACFGSLLIRLLKPYNGYTARDTPVQPFIHAPRSSNQ